MRLRSAAFIAVLLLLASSAGSAEAGEAGLFGTTGRYSSDLSRFTKWNGVLARAAADEDDAAQCGHAGVCAAAWWRNFVTALASLPIRERVERANTVLNRVPYVAAAANWHDPDHWETPREFLARGGQCEDYAIAKFLALEQSGVPEEALRLVVVHDTETGADHAVTVVYVAGEPLVLDNQAADVVAAKPGRYVPYYSINRTGWWFHGAPQNGLRIAGAASQSTAR